MSNLTNNEAHIAFGKEITVSIQMQWTIKELKNVEITMMPQDVASSIIQGVIFNSVS